MIYSAVLLAGQLPESSSISSGVPEGSIWVVRSISLTAGAPGLGQIYVTGHGGVIIYGVPELTPWETAVWNGRQALNPGDILTCACLSPGPWVYISGYSLSLP